MCSFYSIVFVSFCNVDMKENPVFILILLQNWQVCGKTHSMLKQLLGVDVMGRTRICNWFSLEVAEMSNDNDKCSG